MKFDRKRVAQGLSSRPQPNSLLLFGIIMDSMIADIKGNPGYSAETIRHLCHALHDEFVREAEDPSKLTFTQGTEANDIFRLSALEAFQSEIPGATLESDDLPDWPDNLPMDVPLPVSLVIKTGHYAGFRSAVGTKVWEDYYRYYDPGMAV